MTTDIPLLFRREAVQPLEVVLGSCTSAQRSRCASVVYSSKALEHLVNRIFGFKHHLRVEVVSEEQIFLLSERERFLLRSRLYGRVVPFIDGQRTVREIIAALAGEVSPVEVLYALGLLEKKGYIEEAKAPFTPEVAAFWQSLGAQVAHTSERLKATPVAIQSLGETDPALLATALSDAGLHVHEHAVLSVLLVDDYLNPSLEAWNQEALKAQRPWLLVKTSGVTPWIGPLFRPGQGPCWACLAQRLRMNRPVELFLQRRRGATEPPTVPQAALPGSLRMAADLAALMLARWIADGGKGLLDDKFLELELDRFATVEHFVPRSAQCAACGDPELLKKRALRPLALVNRPKLFTTDGGYRTVSPEQTFARHSNQISPLTGVVASLGPVLGRDHPLRPVFGAVYRVMPRGETASSEDFHRTSMGKGRTVAQARTGALCEAVERQSAAFQGDEPRIRARWKELGDDAIHPNELQNFSEEQFRAREELNARVADPRRTIPLPFDEQVPIDWTPVWSLTHQRHRYVPTAYCYLGAPVPPEERFCGFNPNGHAAGNCLEEAILQAFLELVERDAIALWWYGRIRRPGVDGASFGEPYFSMLEEHYRDMGWRAWVLDLTHDLGIPTFAALAQAADTGRFCVGFGCHLDARLALSRAYTELNQLFDPSGRSAAPWDAAAVEDPSFLFPSDTVVPRQFKDYSVVRHEDLLDDVSHCVTQAERAGLEVLVLDQTRPDMGLSASKVIVPGLRHFWPRFGPGRLYDVPVRLGWLSRPLRESELNPVHIFL